MRLSRRGLLFVSTALLMLSLSGGPAFADIDIVPDDYAPEVTIRADEQVPPNADSKHATRQPSKQRFRCFENIGSPDSNCEMYDLSETIIYWAPPGGEDITPGDILKAAREVAMPALKLRIQPGGETLVNVETIFYTDPSNIRRTVTLLGHSVQLDARPVRFTWVHGDGTRATTTRPGRPYPAKDVTHRYEQPGEGLRARVDTTYAVRYSIDGGDWADLGETLTAPGPSTTLDVDEAAPVLTR